jgi:hypothetical protein
MRLAMLYALLDRSALIGPDHLRAALALWEYAERSARYIFGSSLGDASADAILQLLSKSPNGVTRNEIRQHFQRHKDSSEIDRALMVLLEHGLARRAERETGGRPAEVWLACA